MLDRLTSRQLSEWEAYDTLDPVGSWRDDYRMSVLSSLIVNIVNRLYAEKGRTVKDVTPMDFMPDWTGDRQKVEEKGQSVEDMKKIMLDIAKAQNEKGKKEKNKLTRKRGL